MTEASVESGYDSRFLVLGPFSGGMNTYSQAGAIDDNEVVECMNLISDIDGSFKCRPPLVMFYENGPGFGNKQVDAVGSAIINGVNYIFVSNASGIWRYNGTNWALIAGTVNVHAQSCVQYKNYVYFVAQPSSVNPGGRWDGTTYSSLAGMPKGQACLIYKERMWIAPGKHASSNGSRLYFSNIADPSVWTTGTDYFDITPGDGSNVVDLVVFNNNLLIFKQGSTFYLSYDSKPADAILTKISNTIGASNWRCVVDHKNEIFVMHETAIYQLVNFNWVQVNTKVPFVLDATSVVWSFRKIHTFICMVGDWLLCRYHNKVYVYNTNNQTWSQWTSVDEVLRNFGPLIQMPADDLFNVIESYYCGSTIDGAGSVIRIRDGWDSTTIESGGSGFFPLITAYIITKTYSFDLPYKFKRLWSWAVECITNRDITGEVFPTAISNPSSVSTTTLATAGVLKRVYRFPKGLRFRELAFKVTLTSDGSTADGPAQLYTLMAAAKTSSLVPRSVN